MLYEIIQVDLPKQEGVGLGTCIVLYATGSSSPEAGTVGMMVSIAANPVFSLLRPRA